jgi:hypothetical protein
MVKTMAILAFIGATGAGAVALAMKKTVIDGKVMAADLLAQLDEKGITDVTCDPEIPVGAAGATFKCKIAASDGSTASIEYTMNRAGGLSAKVLDGTGPTQERVPSSSDPWNN